MGSNLSRRSRMQRIHRISGSLRWFSFSLIFILAQGCLTVPAPHRRLHAYGMRGRVVDEKGKPIPNVTVISPARNTRLSDTAIPKRQTVTDSNGFFDLSPVLGWHGAFTFNPITGDYSTYPNFHYTFRKWELQHGNTLYYCLANLMRSSQLTEGRQYVLFRASFMV